MCYHFRILLAQNVIDELIVGLFHKAIAQSGVALNPWAFTRKTKQYAYKVCEFLGNKTQDHKAIVDFLRSIDSHKLIEAQEKLLTEEVSKLFEL